MPVVMARVDNRLVHGQVLEAWVPSLAAEAILVVDEELVSDRLQVAVLAGLSTHGLPVRLVTPAEAVGLLRGSLGGKRVLVLFAGIRQALVALERGVAYDRLNLGNLHPRAGSRAVTTSVYLTSADESMLRELLCRGVSLEARAVPVDRSPDLRAWVEGEE